MKRILAILCVIACLCGLCVPAMAANTVTIHAYVPSEWTNVGAYTWEPEDFGTWPGTKMTKAADGSYEITMPGTHTTLIINSDNGQTVDINIEPGKDIWVKVLTTTNAEGKHEYEIGYSKDTMAPPASAPSTPDAPAGGVNLSGLNSLALVGTGIPGVGEWNPGDAAGDMTKVSEGIYTKVIAVTAGASMKFKIAGNDMWDDNYNFGGAEDGATVALGTKLDLTNGGGSKDITLTADKDCNLKFTVDLSGDALTLLVEETDEEAGVTPPSTPDVELPEGEKVTVYVKFPDDWKGACVWAWKEPGPVNATDAAWPGDLVLVKGDNGWWSVQVPNWVNCLLINGNGGSVQTPDIKDLQAGKDLWVNAYTDFNNPVVAYEEITNIEQPTDPADGPGPSIHATEGLKNNEQTKTENKGGKDLTVLLSVVGAVVIIAVAAVIIIIVKGKKKA